VESLLSKVSSTPLAFGGAAISGEGRGYGFGAIDETKSQELLEKVWDLGVRVFDTAPIYGFGLSEQRIGKFAKGPYENAFVISKSGVSWHSSKRVNMTNCPKETEKMLTESLKRLGRDYIDLYMIHWPDPKVDIRRPMEVLAKAKNKQLIKHIGLCNTNLSELAKASEVEQVEVVQSELNLFNPSAKTELIPYCEQHHISFMSWGTLDKGILSGRVDEKRTFDSEDCRSWAPWWKKQDKGSKFKVVSELKEYLKPKGISLLDLALAHNKGTKGVDSILCGGRSIEQWEGLFKAMVVNVDPKVLDYACELAEHYLNTENI
jgi:aryl-alcohol dehydrogenase-like predicted oxidoreductase